MESVAVSDTIAIGDTVAVSDTVAVANAIAVATSLFERFVRSNGGCKDGGYSGEEDKTAEKFHNEMKMWLERRTMEILVLKDGKMF